VRVQTKAFGRKKWGEKKKIHLLTDCFKPPRSDKGAEKSQKRCFPRKSKKGGDLGPMEL